MSNLFNLESPFWQGMAKVGDTIWLSILWLICCLPIVTIGPATTALYYVMLKRVRDEEGNITRQFFHSFKSNFRQGAVIGIIMTLGIALLFLDILFYRETQGDLGTILWWVSMIILVFVLMLSTYIFPLVAKFENTVKNYFVFAVYMSIRHFKYSIRMLLTLILVLFLLYFIFPPFIIMFMGITAYFNAKCLVKIFDDYIPEEEKKPMSAYEQGFDAIERAAAEKKEESVHIVLDMDNPKHIVLGDADSLKNRKGEDKQ